MAGFLSDLVQYRKLLLMILVLGIGGTHLSGFQISVINYTSPYIQKFINETWLERYGSVLHQETLTLLWSFIVSMYCVGGMLGCLCSGYLTAKYGKKKCLLFNDVVLIVAVLHTGFSKRAKSFEMILVGRFLEGIGAGIHTNAHVQYAGEISPKKLRGFINVTTSVFLALGKAVARILGLRDLLGAEDTWNVLLSFSGMVALIQLLFLPFFPESPPYLLMQKGDKPGCLKAMKQLWGEGNYQTEYDDLMKEKSVTKSTKIMNVLQVLKEPSVYPQLSTMLLLLLSLQLCGLSAITFYTSEIFKTANLQESIIPYVSLGVAICELISVIFCDQFLWMRYCSVILIFLFIIAYGIGPGEYNNKSTNREPWATSVRTGHRSVERELHCVTISLKINSLVWTEIREAPIFDELVTQERISLTKYLKQFRPSGCCFLSLDYRFEPKKYLEGMNTAQRIQAQLAYLCLRTWAAVASCKYQSFFNSSVKSYSAKE
ncbi:solute carrier family 2, facilitated glucose transporter member 11 isoform X4 [Cuculus canorus]|uniref:solute carrier family 2, facilitated glucose transporter member 11 isoform X4 n=1 Tax=Cuculus canorus TaxID=55661 RepID=UPI0023AA7D5E|nr:solute carrier family 2, facilitated glucose transporter member 11 isoform X4 [Cuculus canorus]